MQEPTPAVTKQPADEATTARRRRDHELTMAERLERVHRLCAELATLRPVRTEQDE